MEPGKDRGAVCPVSWRAPVDGCDHEGHPVGRKGCTTKRYCPFFAQSQQKPSPRCNFACSGALQEWPRKEERGDAAEWELAARGRLDGAELVWSDSSTPVGRRMANTWQGWRTGVTSSTRSSRKSGFHAGSSKAARISARQSTVAATGHTQSRRIRPPSHVSFRCIRRGAPAASHTEA